MGSVSKFLSTELEAAKLEWGNSDHLGDILQKHNDGFDLILGADIYILMFDNDFLSIRVGQWLILILSIQFRFWSGSLL